MFQDQRFKTLKSLWCRHGLVAVCVAVITGLVWLGTPAWAAPVKRPLNQTVPDPTATSESGPVATATPRPDDVSDGTTDEGSDLDPDAESVDPDATNIDFPDGPDSSNSTQELTALVTVDGLNLRDGPGTGFNPLGSLAANTTVSVLSRNEDGTWWYVCCLQDTTTHGWASAQLLTPNFDAAQALGLLPLFGDVPTVPATATPHPTNRAQPAGQPLTVDFFLEPYFVWQGITATLTITLTNPNTFDAEDVLLSDELPVGLTLVSAEASAGGTVEIADTPMGQPLLLFRWESIPADTGVTATIVAVIDDDLPNGAVIDNLVATRARNVAYGSGAVTIGLPPVVPPDFQ